MIKKTVALKSLKSNTRNVYERHQENVIITIYYKLYYMCPTCKQ